jgi:hypothetical protein
MKRRTNIKKMRKNLQRGDCNLAALPYENLSPRNRRKLIRLAVSLTEVKKEEVKEPEPDTESLVDEIILIDELQNYENIH